MVDPPPRRPAVASAPRTLLERVLGQGRPRARIVAAASVLAVISGLDSITDPNVTFALFYVLPVALTAWRCSRGIAFSYR